MTVNVLFVGLGGTNSGKTALAAALLRTLCARGIRAAPVKPFGGSNAWTDAEDVFACLRQRRLFGHDSHALRLAAQVETREENVAPVHRLWAAAPHEHQGNPDVLPAFIADRVSVSADPAQDRLIVNGALAFEHGLEARIEELGAAFRDLRTVRTLEELNRLQRESYAHAVMHAVRTARERAQVVVYESFGGACLPWLGIEELALVVGVHPGYFELYDGAAYLAQVARRVLPEARARTLLAQSRIPWEDSGNLLCFFEARAIANALEHRRRVTVPVTERERLAGVLDRQSAVIADALGPI